VIYTSSFKLSGRHPGAVAISNGTRPYRVCRYPPLTPARKLVRDSKAGLIDQVTFNREYITQLRALDPRHVLSELGAMVPAQSYVILLCWEAPGEYCHRRIAAGWLESELGILVPELTLR
jgi:hypothetical protein